MENPRIDLHTHTNYSDGALSPRELLARAHAYQLAAISITDHDTVVAYHEGQAIEIARSIGVELVPGIEWSTRDEHDRKYHILGLLIDVSHPDILRTTSMLAQRRLLQAQRTCERLRELGWHVDVTTLLERPGTVTRAHIALAITAHPKNAERLQEVFGRIPNQGELIESLLIRGKPAYVPADDNLSPQEAISLTHTAGGLAILAHPAFNIMHGENIDELCERLARLGIDGFEAINIQYDPHTSREVRLIEEFRTQAQARGLVISGGSDFHTSDKTTIGAHVDLGMANVDVIVPYSVLSDLRERVSSRTSM